MSLFAKGLEYGRLAFTEVGHRARTVEEDLKARREVDISGMVNGLRARLAEQFPLEELPIDADLRSHALPLDVAKVSTWAYRSPKLRKIVLSHIVVGPTVLPAVEGLALTVFPETEWDVPCFLADLMALPWWVSVNADVYGRDWQTQKVLSGLRSAFLRLGSGQSPPFCARISSGDGLHAKLRPRQVEEGFAALTQALSAYLQLLQDPPPGRSDKDQQEVFAAFHAHGPRMRLRRPFGDAFAERYSRLLFE
jgi:hypothetical protein